MDANAHEFRADLLFPVSLSEKGDGGGDRRRTVLWLGYGGLDPEDRELKTLGGEVPSPVTPPPGCRFHTRCPKRMEKCDREAVPFFDVDGVCCRCFLYET